MVFPEGTRIWFASDVHLGLRQGDPAERERRFLSWLDGIPTVKGDVICLLGDVWDFWYEYRDVVPKEGFRVLAKLSAMMDAGMKVLFVPGNHDIWCYSFFEELGIVKLPQCEVLEVGSTRIMVAHGDRLGGAPWGYRFMLGIFHSRVCQRLFSLLHPTIAFRFGKDWSAGNRKTHAPYVWKGDEREPLYRFCMQNSDEADIFVFGHYHVSVDQPLPDGRRLLVLGDWISSEGTPHAIFSSSSDLSVGL